MRKAIALVPLLLLFAFTAAGQQPAQGNGAAKELAAFIRANYTKYEAKIPMRDGAQLFTSIYVPKDASETNRYPILLTRTPYTVDPYGPDAYKELLGPSEPFTRSKYIVVYQDVRGRWMSEGDFVDVRPHEPGKVGEATDTWDTIDWLVRNVANNNGRVGIWGISYPGYYAAVSLIDSHPALVAVSPQAPIADWWIGDDFHHHGTLYLPHFFGFYYSFGQPRPEPTVKRNPGLDYGTPDGYDFYRQLIPLSGVERFYKGQVSFWKEVAAHPDYDAFWKARNLPQHLRNVKPAVMTVGGWFDAENLYGALATYRAAEQQNPGIVNILVMGPWFHGGWARSDGARLGAVEFNQETAVFYREQIEFPFFEFHLKKKGKLELPEAFVFETGRNEWKRYESWPPRSALKKTLYLQPNGRLAWTAPSSESSTAAGVFDAGVAEFDEWVSDPARPVHFIDATGTGMTKEYMVADQRLQGRRPDVMTYVTPVLDKDVTLAGPIRATLHVSTTGTDADFVVKVIDVYPGETPDPNPNPTNVRMGGYQQLVRGEPFRGRYRNSFSTPQPFEPGKVEKIEYTMPDVNHTFRRGHRIMVQVQSSWFPLMDVNPQTFVPNIFNAKVEDFRKATHRVYHAAGTASALEVTVLPSGF